jgi:hypothetical protein
MGTGTGTYDINTHEYLLNYVNPLRRDVATIPPRGWAVIRSVHLLMSVVRVVLRDSHFLVLVDFMLILEFGFSTVTWMYVMILNERALIPTP